MNFNVNEFESIKSFNGRKEYADNNLQRLGSGSGRIVYAIDDNKVLKLAKNNKGIAQNQAEINLSNEYYENILAKVLDYDNNYLWIISERTKKITPTRFTQLTNVKLNDLNIFLRNYDAELHGKRPIFSMSKELNDELYNNEFVSELLNFISDTNSNVGDMARISTYGEINRKGTPMAVLNDYGLTHEVYDSFYSRKFQESYQIDELLDLNKEDELTNFVNPWYDHNLGFGLEPQHVDESIENLKQKDSDIIAYNINKKLNIGNKPIFLSKGKNGYAYNLGNNKILKITTDISEAIESKKILNKKNNHIADIYNVFQIEYNNKIFYAIILEKLKINPELFKSYYNFFDKLFISLFNEDYYTILMFYFRNKNAYDEKFNSEINKHLSKFIDKYKFYNELLAIINEQKQNGIKNSDFLNPYNLGYKSNGNLAVFDLGSGDELEYYKFTGKKPETIKVESENINERIKSYMPGSKEIMIRRKCMLGGNEDGTSEPCNQGDINNIILKPIKEDKIDESMLPSMNSNYFKNKSKEEIINYFDKIQNLINIVQNKQYLSDEDIENAVFYYYILYYNGKIATDVDTIKYSKYIKFLRDILINRGKIKENYDINESRLIIERTGDIEYGCAMLGLDISNWNNITSMIEKDDIYDKEGYNIEKEPHVTLLYGFKENVKANDVFDIFKAISSIEPFQIIVTGISYFENEEFDVVKLDVELTKNLKRLNRYMKELPYEKSVQFGSKDNYIPHITIAYVKKGTGKKYKKIFDEKIYLVANKLVYSDKNKNKITLDLNNGKIIEENVNLNKNNLLNLIESVINESESKYSETKQSLLNSKSIPKEMKEKILPYITSGSKYHTSKKGNGGVITELLKPKEFTNKTPKSSGVSLGADKKGFFCFTHRASSKRYESPEKIPIKDIEFIESTG